MLDSRRVQAKAGHSESFFTIDDAIGLANRLSNVLTWLGEQKHPLDVRKGMVVKQERREVGNVKDSLESRQVKAGSRTYFIDVVAAKDQGGKYLRITESRYHGEGKERERSTIFVFAESVREFVAAVTELGGKVG